jgi:hypothetical protein
MNTSQVIKHIGYNMDPYLLIDYCVAKPAAARASLAYVRRTQPRVMALLRAQQYLTSYRTLCLPAGLYALLTAINIYCKNLHGCLSEYWNQHPTRCYKSVTFNPFVLYFLIYAVGESIGAYSK